MHRRCFLALSEAGFCILTASEENMKKYPKIDHLLLRRAHGAPQCPENSSPKQRHKLIWNSFLFKNSLQEGTCVFDRGNLPLPLRYAEPLAWQEPSETCVSVSCSEPSCRRVLREVGPIKGDCESPSEETKCVWGCLDPYGGMKRPPEAAEQLRRDGAPLRRGSAPTVNTGTAATTFLQRGMIRQGSVLCKQACSSPGVEKTLLQKGPLTSWLTPARLSGDAWPPRLLLAWLGRAHSCFPSLQSAALGGGIWSPSPSPTCAVSPLPGVQPPCSAALTAEKENGRGFWAERGFSEQKKIIDRNKMSLRLGSNDVSSVATCLIVTLAVLGVFTLFPASRNPVRILFWTKVRI